MKKIVKNYVLLCDYASLGEGGKPNILGIFKNIQGKNFPVIHPQMYLVTSFVLPEKGAYKEKIELIKSSKKKTILANLSFDINVNNENESEYNTIANFTNIKFDEPGNYEFIVSFNDEPVATLPITLSELRG